MFYSTSTRTLTHRADESKGYKSLDVLVIVISKCYDTNVLELMQSNSKSYTQNKWEVSINYKKTLTNYNEYI